MLNVYVYGDSIMKATSTDESRKMHFNIKAYLDRLAREFPVNVINRAHFGATSLKGLSLLKKDLEKGLSADSSVLLAFGGNDCDYNWKEVSDRPEDTHEPNVPLPKFIETLTEMTALIRNAGAKPIFMTPPPICAEKYFAHITRNGLNPRNVLRWLGDVQEIYRHHENYAGTIVRLARELNAAVIDIRRYFLSRHDFKSLISVDGIHLTLKGYDIIYEAFANHLREILA